MKTSTPRMMLRRSLDACTIGMLVWTATACSSSKSTSPTPLFEALPVTAATVQAAVELMTTGPVVIPSSCGASPALNCLGGTAGSPVSIGITRSAVTVVQSSPGVYAFGVDLGITSLQPIPVNYLGVDCTVSLNTANGATPTVHVAGTATFTSTTTDGPTNRIDLTQATTGLESADMTIGGGTLCAFASVFQSTFLSTVSNALDAVGGHLCGAPGPTLFKSCTLVGKPEKIRRAA